MANYNSFKRFNSEAIVDGEVVSGEIANSTITTTEIADDAVTAAKIQDGAVTDAKLNSTLDISGKTVTYRPIANGDISSSAAISGSKFTSGAFSSNLGGTPLNKAGGTMTGQLKTTTGSAGAPAIYRSGDADTGISFNGTSTTVSAAGRAGLVVNTNNNVTRPNSVAFTASGTSGWRYANSYGGTGWRSLNGTFGWTVEQKGGSNFNTNNGAFTAPINGFYQFHFETYARNDRNNTQGYYHMSFGINGGNQMVGGRTPHGMYGHGNAQRYYPNGTHVDLGTYLNASQYVQVRVFWHNNQTRFHGAHSCFNGYMIA
jgi:hypothetical protein